MSREELSIIINDIYNKYEDTPVILNRFRSYIHNLPELLENTNTTIIEREKRKNKLEKESELFTQKFLNNNKFFYHSTSELFFQYNNKNFLLVKEDDVQHTILSSISSHKTLMDWKQKLKVSILKKIKERDLFSCIPESETIQNVINSLYPTICDNREKAKYFLTIIGDILLKKNNLIYFLHPKTKPFLKALNSLVFMLFGTPNLLNIFKFKFYEHTFTDCRFADLWEFINIDNWHSYVKENDALDLFCVAAHYSTRYGSADGFLSEHCKDPDLIKYALYLKNNDENDIVDHFVENTMEEGDGCSISWKNIQFLWKRFIDSEKFPNVFFTNVLKNKLIEKLTYNEETDMFMGYTSKLLPRVSKFIKFWSDHIEINEDINEELEIDELCSLFTYHTKTNINEKNILDLIKHYYSDIFIEDDKYLLNTRCKLWNKKEDIINALKKYKLINSDVEMYNGEEIPINEIYQIYCGSKNKFTVSKRYFEKFIKEETDLYIVDDNFIKVNSFENI